MLKHLVQVKVKRAERHRTPKATDHLYQLGYQVLVLIERQINNLTVVYRSTFRVFIFNAYSKFPLVEEKPSTAHKRDSTMQVKPYVDEPEEVTVNFMLAMVKAITDYRHLEDVTHSMHKQITIISHPYFHR